MVSSTERTVFKGSETHRYLYIEIIEPLGHRAKERNEEFLNEYAKVINKLTREFSTEYCDQNGSILWEKLVKFNSGKLSNE